MKTKPSRQIPFFSCRASFIVLRIAVFVSVLPENAHPQAAVDDGRPTLPGNPIASCLTSPDTKLQTGSLQWVKPRAVATDSDVAEENQPLPSIVPVSGLDDSLARLAGCPLAIGRASSQSAAEAVTLPEPGDTALISALALGLVIGWRERRRCAALRQFLAGKWPFQKASHSLAGKL